MRLILLALPLLAACAMSPDQACLSARVALAAMEGGGVPEGYTLDRAREDAAAVCAGG